MSTISSSRYIYTPSIGDTLSIQYRWDETPGEWVEDWKMQHSISSEGINEGEFSEAIMYPNPVEENLYIENYSGDIAVISTSGVVLLKQEVFLNQSINVSALKPGFYILSLDNNSSSKTFINKYIQVPEYVLIAVYSPNNLFK